MMLISMTDTHFIFEVIVNQGYANEYIVDFYDRPAMHATRNLKTASSLARDDSGPKRASRLLSSTRLVRWLAAIHDEYTHGMAFTLRKGQVHNVHG